MTALNQDFSIHEGEDKTIEFYVTDSSGGSPVNLGTPTSVTWTVRLNAGASGDALIEKTLADGEISVANGDDTLDKLSVALDAADSQGLEGVSYYHECRVVDADSDNHVIASGCMTIKHSATG